MTTYSKWLEMQAGRDDIVGEIGKIWAGAGQTGNRPKAHSPVGITGWFTEQYHAEPERLASYKAAIEQGVTERQREATAHLHAVPPGAPSADPVGEQIVAVLQAMQVLLESHSRQLGRLELALGIEPVEGTVRPWIAAVNATDPSVTRPLPDGDLNAVWPELWQAADHTAQAE